jgi:thiopurine S-methyltransferase
MRRRYVEELYSRLPDHCRGLLITLEYPQHEKAGPPFAVVEDEVRALYGHHWRVETLARNLILPDHPGYVDGVSRLETVVYALRRS